MRVRSSLTISLVSALAILSMMIPMPVSASLDKPFGGFSRIRMLDGIIIVAECTTENPLTRTGFWQEGKEVLRGTWLNVVWEYQGVEAKGAGWTAWMAVSDPTAKSGKDSYSGGKLIAWEKNAYRIDRWVYVDPMMKASTLSITCGVQGKKGELDKTDKIIIPISNKCIELVVKGCDQPSTQTTTVATQPVSIVMQSGSSSNQTVLASGSVPVTRPTKPPKEFILEGDYSLVITNRSLSYTICGLKGIFNQKVVFARSGYRPICAEISSVQGGKIYAELEANAGVIMPNSDIIFDKVGELGR